MVKSGGIEQFLRSMMAILASRSMTAAEKLHCGGMLIQTRIESRNASVMLYDELKRASKSWPPVARR